jgi:hypothetical protein
MKEESQEIFQPVSSRTVMVLIAVVMISVFSVSQLCAQGRHRQLVLENPVVWVDGSGTVFSTGSGRSSRYLRVVWS